MTSKIAYNYIDNGGQNTLLFLHGWGCNKNYMLPISNIKNCNSLVIDLPCFGENSEPDTPYFYDDFIEDILIFINENKFNITHIIAHSFGGKLACKLSNLLKIKGLILIAPSIFNKRRGVIYYLKIITYKVIKRYKKLNFISSKMGSNDYKSLSSVMKKTMSNVINKNIIKEVKKISVPTILLFGKKDKITPIHMGKKIKKLIKDSELIILNGNHFAYLYNKQKVMLIIESLVNQTCN